MWQNDSSYFSQLRQKPTIYVVLSLLAITLPGLSIESLKAGNKQEVKADSQIAVDENDWPWWRGPQRNGVAVADQKPPLHWSESENILWRSPVPGLGHGSPTVVGGRVFLATADYDKEVQSVLCYNRHSGERIWKTDVHRGGFPKGGHKKAGNTETPSWMSPE